ncbi:MAG: hypothetical protein CVU41_10165 [Chloroflexi bacterium HGW-Chloroflexi-3]|nr:MAG: hypothetical protein CVU41_10165 [Chloroflexi bacterium HGW-Chloroflexi-3]
MKPVELIQVVDLFPALSKELISVLKSLKSSNWEQLTICSPWSVKDVAAHLLGGNFGRLWYHPAEKIKLENQNQNFDQLVKIINQNNELWVKAAKRISPELLIELLQLTDQYLYVYFKKLNPYETAGITVAWASNHLPPNWLDIAREFTEKWLHQQHIREAVDLPLLTDKKWLTPVLDTFMLALPFSYRFVEREVGTSISIQITGEAGKTWTLVRDQFDWQLFIGHDTQAVTSIQLDQNTAWRLFTKAVSKENASKSIKISGDIELGEKIFQVVSIMA